tara:strand:- start:11 stop:409 length:399 start_codon:yes stop_codon:yes gene_type:complete
MINLFFLSLLFSSLDRISSVSLLTEAEVSQCVTMLGSLKPEIRYQTLGVAWNNLAPHERAHVLRTIALFEKEDISGDELSYLAQQDDIEVVADLDDEHQCVPRALKTAPTSIWKTMSEAERHLTLHDLRTSL